MVHFGLDVGIRPRLAEERALKDLPNSTQKAREVKTLMFIVDLPFRFIFAFLGFTFCGWIGWLGIVLIALRFFRIIGWPWWVAALPLEYGVLYCLYMTIDGALYRGGPERYRSLRPSHGH
jgi:hypothetical protein